MMNKQELQKALSTLPLGEIRFFDSIGSTNDEALAWATEQAQDLSIVIADEQTAGRGRLDRKWLTPKESALAFSLILRPRDQTHLSRTVGLAALSIADSCLGRGLAPKIKWPNDVLLNNKKVAGILIESVWSGAEIDCLVIGMGINVTKESIPPEDILHFPATSMEEVLGTSIDRIELLHAVLASFVERREKTHTDEFISQWEELLAFRGEQVQIINKDEQINSGLLIGLNEDGSLKLLNAENKIVSAQFGDVSLRPAV